MEYPKGVRRKGAYRGSPHQDSMPSGTGQHRPHPNGGDVRLCDVDKAPMPKQHKARPIVNKPLPVGQGNAGLGKVSNRNTAPRSNMEPQR